MPILESNNKFIVECDCIDGTNHYRKINCCYRFLRKTDQKPFEFDSIDNAISAVNSSGWVVRGSLKHRIYCSYCSAVLGFKKDKENAKRNG